MKIKRPKSPEDAAASLIFEARQQFETCERERVRIAATLAEMERNLLPAIVRKMGRRWLTNEVPPFLEAQAIDDPIYGHILLDQILATVVSHPLLQRLARVKQLSFSFAQFPSARHSRLSHSLGVAKNAEMAVNGMLNRGVYYVEGETHSFTFEKDIIEQRHALIQKAQLVALLHDVGHGPFGHALDNYAGIELGVPRPDKTYTTTYVKQYLAPTLTSLGIDDANILSILGPDRAALKGMDHLIGDIVDSSLDVDRMDYLMRDAHMTGLMMGFINTMALINFMKPVLDEGSFILAYDEKALGYMEHLILARDTMFFNCYEHPRKKAAERIFTRLIKKVVEDARLGLSMKEMFALADEELTTILRGIGTGDGMSQNFAEELMGDLNYVSVYEISATEKEGTLPPKIEAWLADVTGDEKEVAYIVRPDGWERSIAQNSIGVERAWQIQVVLPDPGVYLQQHSATKLLKKDDRGRYKAVNFFDDSLILKNILEHMNRQRQTIMVMCPARLPNAERNQIRNAAETFFTDPETQA